jgi:hypothetical protein
MAVMYAMGKLGMPREDVVVLSVNADLRRSVISQGAPSLDWGLAQVRALPRVTPADFLRSGCPICWR